jgi:tetratricopeptide (TPR) repeat protein
MPGEDTMSHGLRRYRRVWLLCGIIVLVAALQVLIYPRWYRLTPAELYQQAYAALLRDEKAESLRLLAQVHRRAPNIELSRFIAGWCQHCLSNYDAAIIEYRLAMRHTPGYAQTYANMGYVLKELGRYDEAATAFTQHLQREPSNALSQAALDECRQRAASATGATAQILFLSPGT